MRKVGLCILFVAAFIVSTVRAELLIVKKDGDGFVPLSDQDTAQHGKQLQDILLKYQWPMVISSDLTESEQNELLSAGVKYAEEKFIEKKVQEVSPDYGVVFIPTTLYELFVIVYLFQTYREKNFFQNAVMKFSVATVDKLNPWEIELTELLNKQESPISIRQQINAVYKKANALFGDDNEEGSVYLYMSNMLISTILDSHSEFKTSDDTLTLSNLIKGKADFFVSFLIQELRFFEPDPSSGVAILKSKIDEGFSSVENKTLIMSIVDLDYKVRELNKALLLRGTSFEEFQVGIGESLKRKKLAGTVLVKEKRGEVIIPFERIYGEKRIRPYSIAFGNSLLAGILLDIEACSCFFLTGKRLYGRRFSSANGYVLLINKKDYFQHRVNNLFFISPLTTLSGLVQYGEYFHSRTKAATILKNNKRRIIRGLHDLKISDPTGVILITRDPLFHAELFSKFLADPDNVRIIQDSKVRRYSTEEESFVKEILNSQAEAAKFYHNTRIVFPILLQKMRQWKKEKGIVTEVLATEEKKIEDAGGIGFKNLTIEDFREAKRNMDSSDIQQKEKALSIFLNFVSEKYAFAAATEAAKKAMNDPRYKIKEKALALFAALVNKGQALAESAEAASKGIENPNSKIRSNTLKLLTDLVDKGHALKEAAEALKQVVDDSDRQVQREVSYLRKALKDRQAQREAFYRREALKEKGILAE